MQRPDFARTDLHPLADRDLRFLIENFPRPGQSYEEIARLIHQLPTTMESLLESDFVFHAMLDRRSQFLDVSPFLFFNVLLRRSLPGRRTREDRNTINYIANLLSLFAHGDRLYRSHDSDARAGEYLWQMIEEAERLDPRQQFLVYSHIGNYALYLTGLFPAWISHRYRYGNRSVDERFYVDFGRAYFERAAGHSLAREYRLSDTFLRLALMFDHYKAALNRLVRDHLPWGAGWATR